MLRTFARVLGAVHEAMDGNVRALQARGQVRVSPRTAFRIALRQTGSLVGAALEAGAIASHAPQPTVIRFRRAGRLLGVALHLREARETGRAALCGVDPATATLCAKRAVALIESCGVSGTWLTHFKEIADYTTSWT